MRQSPVDAPPRFTQVAVPLPDIKGRTDILEYYLADKPVSPLLDRDLIARLTGGFSGADLANLINEAALLAAKQGADVITPAMVDSSYDKISMGVARTSAKQSVEGLTKTAYHEAGHVIVALNMDGGAPIHKATIMFRGHALGMVSRVGLWVWACSMSMRCKAIFVVCAGVGVSVVRERAGEE